MIGHVHDAKGRQKMVYRIAHTKDRHHTGGNRFSGVMACQQKDISFDLHQRPRSTEFRYLQDR